MDLFLPLSDQSGNHVGQIVFLEFFYPIPTSQHCGETKREARCCTAGACKRSMAVSSLPYLIGEEMEAQKGPRLVRLLQSE